ncbi:MAG TPA: hypothetical protein VLB76_15255 [Thermoanaerobaculia bacterium]|nr:hypothetical protein [Thermoanaerobaculia bacterium]
MLGYTLLADGSSDQALMSVLNWLLIRHGVAAFRGRWADLRSLRHPPKRLAARISVALEMYPCDLLFIHRDAEGMPFTTRRSEILNTLSELSDVNLPTICVVPVRMQEAWSLIDEPAIRKAAGNPNGRGRLEIPRLDELESLSNPKEVLHGLLREASGLPPRRKFYPQTSAFRIPEFIDDFSTLLHLSAFERLDGDVREIVWANSWHQAPPTD